MHREMFAEVVSRVSALVDAAPEIFEMDLGLYLDNGRHCDAFRDVSQPVQDHKVGSGAA